MKTRGLTLIETMVYLALLVGLIVASWHAAAGISGVASANEAGLVAEEDGSFVAAKARWLALCAENRESRQGEIIFTNCEGDAYRLNFDSARHTIVLRRAGTSAALAQRVDSFAARADGSILRVSYSIGGIPFEATLLP